MTKYKKDKYKVLVLGGGGRSNALLRSLSESPMLDSLYTTNKHKEFLKHANYLDVDCSNFPRLACACKENQIDIVIPSQEKFLAQGISDALTAEGIEVFGPNKNSSKLESFKSYAKDFCDANDIPTAKHWQFSDKNLACQFLEGNQVFPIVIKADGLASGKGVIICQNIDEAKDAIEVVFSGKLDGKGDVVIIEEFLKGKE
ncbi:phosphoribosylamine--glycine ligase-like, partial [Symsagittifera roscoffensis]|uniref:phosphoribosylamine--glycine ligase-like n=1 Tax=Symsagittifera roscoffensis TaxID=84072 RepID=UPI00307C5486